MWQSLCLHALTPACLQKLLFLFILFPVFQFPKRRGRVFHKEYNFGGLQLYPTLMPLGGYTKTPCPVRLTKIAKNRSPGWISFLSILEILI